MKLKTAILTIAVAVFAAIPAFAAEWTVSEDTDVMTDKSSAFATSAWTKPVKQIAFPYADTEAILGVGCEDGEQWAYFKANELPGINGGEIGDGYREHKILVRFDKETPVTVRVGRSSGSDSLQFLTDYGTESAVEGIAKHNTMLWELDLYGRGIAHFAFDLSGAANAISKVQAQCGISQLADSTFVALAIEGKVDAVKKKLAEGANPNAVNALGLTALYSAAGGHAEVVKILLSAGADPNAANSNGGTALHIASEVLRGNSEVVKILLAAGANPNAANILGATPLHYVLRFGPIEIGNQVAEQIETIKALLAAGADPYAVGGVGDKTPLQLAKEKWSAEIVRMLDAAGAE